MKKNPAAVALGSIKSETKTAASRKNGRKGGRPKEEYIAKLFIKEYPRTKNDEKRLVDWLASIIYEIEKADPHTYSDQCNFRLMK